MVDKMVDKKADLMVAHLAVQTVEKMAAKMVGTKVVE